MTTCIHLGALGDLVLAIPALGCLREAAPRPLRLIAAPPQGRLLERLGVVDRFLDGTRAALAPLFAGQVDGEVAALLGAESPDGGRGEAPLALVYGAPDDGLGGPLEAGLRRLGFRVFAAPVRPRPSEPRHAADVLVDGARAALGALPQPPAAPSGPPARAAPSGRAGSASAAPALHPRGADLAAAAATFAAHGLAAGRTWLVHPGSGGASKRWPEDRWLALLERLRARGEPALAILGPVELEAQPGLAARFEGARVPVAVAPPLEVLVALAALARGFVGNDGGAAHVAAAAGAPTLALFGPSDPRQWAPRGTAPCLAIRAPGGSLAALEVDVVEAALASLGPRADG